MTSTQLDNPMVLVNLTPPPLKSQIPPPFTSWTPPPLTSPPVTRLEETKDLKKMKR